VTTQYKDHSIREYIFYKNETTQDNCRNIRMSETYYTRTVAISLHDRRILPLSDLCKDRTAIKPVILSELYVYSTVRHQVTILITYCGSPVDTIPIWLEVGRNGIPMRNITKIAASGIQRWSMIEFISETPRPNTEEPYALTVEFVVSVPEHSLEDIRNYAQRVYENRSLRDAFIDYLTAEH